MACCVGEKYENWCNGLPTVYTDEEGHTYCEFHAPTKYKTLNSYSVNKLIHKLALENPEQELDLRGAIITERLDINSANLSALKFDDAVFYQPVYFNLCHFSESISIRQATFHHNFLVMDSTFKKDLQIQNTIFKKSLALTRVTNHNAIFITDTACHDAIRIQLESNIDRLTVNVDEVAAINVHTSGAKKKINHYFIYVANNTQESTAETTNFKISNLQLASTLNCSIQFTDCNLDKFDTGHLLLKENITFNGCSFQTIALRAYDLRFIEFIGCTYPQTGKRSVISKIASNLLYPLTPIEQLRENEHIYRRLKKQAQDEESRILASDWHYWEKYYTQQRLKEEGKKFDSFVLKLYRLASDYGENLSRASIVLSLLLMLSIAVGLFKYTGIFLTIPKHTAIEQLSIPNGLGLFTSKGYLALKIIWTDFDWYKALQTTFDFIPLATKSPDTANVSLWRPVELFWQILITFQATLLGFALRNRYRR